MKAKELLEVRDLSTRFSSGGREVRAVDGVDLRIDAGQSVGIVGESGSGKTVTARSIMRLIEPPGRIVHGEIRFRGQDLLKVSEKEMCHVRGRQIAMIFQDPVASLNPMSPVGKQMIEGTRWHLDLSPAQARERAEQFLGSAQVPSPESIMSAYPHQLSGGMCQRAAIAMALSCEPALIIGDEPTSALDATIQAQILALMRDLRERFGTAILLISHDLAVIARVCEYTVVMYAGLVVEEGFTNVVLTAPKHPYTQALIGCIPKVEHRGRMPAAIEGEPPPADRQMPGCPFAPRCPRAMATCAEEPPPWREVGSGHFARCVLAD